MTWSPGNAAPSARADKANHGQLPSEKGDIYRDMTRVKPWAKYEPAGKIPAGAMLVEEYHQRRNCQGPHGPTVVVRAGRLRITEDFHALVGMSPWRAAGAVFIGRADEVVMRLYRCSRDDAKTGFKMLDRRPVMEGWQKPP